MLSCREVADFCFEYLEGSLSDEVGGKFHRHLSLCPECVNFFETYKRTPELSREALATSMPDSVRTAVRAFLRNHCQR